MAVNQHWMTYFVKSKPASPTPLAIATDSGRKAERADVLEYLAALASVTGVEELWEAVTYIKGEYHVRHGRVGPL